MATKLPRLNVTVTKEQHGLLLELARLNGGSAAGYLRQMLDQATPLLRVTVPMMRAAAEEMEVTREKAAQLLAPVLQELRDSPLMDQPELLELLRRDDLAPPPGAPAASGSERGRTKRQARKPRP